MPSIVHSKEREPSIARRLPRTRCCYFFFWDLSPFGSTIFCLTAPQHSIVLPHVTKRIHNGILVAVEDKNIDVSNVLIFLADFGCAVGIQNGRYQMCSWSPWCISQMVAGVQCKISRPELKRRRELESLLDFRLVQIGSQVTLSRDRAIVWELWTRPVNCPDKPQLAHVGTIVERLLSQLTVIRAPFASKNSFRIGAHCRYLTVCNHGEACMSVFGHITGFAQPFALWQSQPYFRALFLRNDAFGALFFTEKLVQA